MFTDDLDVFAQGGHIMCWPFWAVRNPTNRLIGPIVFTFDGSTYAVYEGGHDAHSANRLWRQNHLEVTRNPDEQYHDVSAVLRVSHGGQPVAVIPIYRSGDHDHDSILWHSGIWIIPQRLDQMVLQAWDKELHSLYGHFPD